jgi:hypothetical protein
VTDSIASRGQVGLFAANLLTAVMGYAELARSEDGNPDDQEASAAAAERLEGLAGEAVKSRLITEAEGQTLRGSDRRAATNLALALKYEESPLPWGR